MVKAQKIKVKRPMSPQELEARQRSKNEINMDCEYMVREFERKQAERKNKKVSW